MTQRTPPPFSAMFANSRAITFFASACLSGMDTQTFATTFMAFMPLPIMYAYVLAASNVDAFGTCAIDHAPAGIVADLVSVAVSRKLAYFSLFFCRATRLALGRFATALA